jgi:hypothetical protein
MCSDAEQRVEQASDRDRGPAGQDRDSQEQHASGTGIAPLSKSAPERSPIERESRPQGIAGFSDCAAVCVRVTRHQDDAIDQTVSRLQLLTPKKRLPVAQPSLCSDTDSRAPEIEEHIPRPLISWHRDGGLEAADQARIEERQELSDECEVRGVPERPT